jgi:GntR family transcriptional regulator
VDQELVEKRRGIGMYVVEGATEKLLASERERFLQEEWPKVLLRIEKLGLSLSQLSKLSQQTSQGEN